MIIDRDAGVYPMVGPGLGYRDMITGDWIVKRTEVGGVQDDGPVDMTKIPDLF